MRILSLVWVFGVVGGGASCGGRAAKSSAAAPSSAAAAVSPQARVAAGVSAARLCAAPPAGAAPLSLPAAEASRELALDVHRPGGVEPADWKGKLTVDGVVTGAMWPMHAPAQYRLPDGRVLLDDTYNANLLMLWDPRTRTLTELARGVLVRVPGHGMLVHTEDGANTDVGVFSDIDPAAPRLRELWRFERDKAAAAVVGAIDGMPAVMLTPPAGGERPAGPMGITLLCLTGDGVSSRLDAVVPEGFGPIAVDPIDGHRMLLLGSRDVLDVLGSSSWDQPFSAEVAILDLATGAVRSLGRAAGAWTRDTAIPHPYIDVRWGDGATAPGRGPWFATEVVTRVDPATERLFASGP